MHLFSRILFTLKALSGTNRNSQVYLSSARLLFFSSFRTSNTSSAVSKKMNQVRTGEGGREGRGEEGGRDGGGQIRREKGG